MQSKILGYVLGIAGILVLSLTLKPIKNADFLPRKAAELLVATPNYLIIGVGVILVAVAFIFLKQAGGKQPKEVPIYHGKNIVGYRRMGKK